MKRISIIALLLISAVTLGFGQEKSQKEKSKKNLPSPLIEVWGGMGVMTAMGTASSTDFRMGGLFGVGVSIPISEQNNIHAEIAYTFQGFKYNMDSITPNPDEKPDETYKLESAEQRFNYFKVIVMDKYFIDKKRMFYVNGGIYGAYLSQARYQLAYNIPDPDPYVINRQEVDDENKEDFNPYDFGVEGGFGLRLGNKSTSNFTIEARASYGMMNIAKQDIGTGNNFYGVLKLGFDIPVRSK